jgi:hypothetical protein
MHKKIERTGGSGAEDRLTPFEVAVLSRVVRAEIIPEADLVTSWGMGPWATQALDVAFPPSGTWLTYEGLPLNFQPPDLLMQLIEFFLARDGVMKANASETDIRPARLLKKDLLGRIGEIKTMDGSVGEKS